MRKRAKERKGVIEKGVKVEHVKCSKRGDAWTDGRTDGETDGTDRKKEKEEN